MFLASQTLTPPPLLHLPVPRMTRHWLQHIDRTIWHFVLSMLVCTSRAVIWQIASSVSGEVSVSSLTTKHVRLTTSPCSQHFIVHAYCRHVWQVLLITLRVLLGHPTMPHGLCQESGWRPVKRRGQIIAIYAQQFDHKQIWHIIHSFWRFYLLLRANTNHVPSTSYFH